MSVLRELHIRNFAVVDEVRLELGAGLSVLTGETGAGKSILVEALALLVGGRPAVDMIRAGEARAVVEGRFEIVPGTDLARACEEAGIETDDGWLILRRELRREGRHRAWVNGTPATTTLLKNLGTRLLDLHGQHEHQRLLDRGAQRRLLDAYGENGALVGRLQAAYDELGRVETELERVRETARVGRERSDYLRFKYEEIEAAELQAGEDEALAIEARRLTHSEDLAALAGELHAGVYEAEDSVVERLGGLRRRLADLTEIDESGAPLLEMHESALRTLEELGRELGRYLDAIEHDPGRLAEIRERLDLLYRLKRKYGDSVDEVIAAGREARRELAGIEGAEDEIARLETERSRRRDEMEAAADRLSGARRRAAAALEEAVGASLPALGLEGGRFVIDLRPFEAPGREGGERVEFLVSLNPGFPPGPLARIASGGEMSRVMLALETALVAVDEVPILVFDEVDAGIGGEVAHRVAERLAQVATRHQVLVVTHLAQIAARAHAHYSVGKEAGEGLTRTHVRDLRGEDRVEEVARMLGGDPASHASRAHAEELLAGGA